MPKITRVFHSTAVAIHTDARLTGHGEVCPLGPAYLPAYAAGARRGIKEPREYRFSSTDFNSYVIVSTAEEARRNVAMDHWRRQAAREPWQASICRTVMVNLLAIASVCGWGLS